MATPTDKQLRFIAEYLIDQNGTRAYRAAYPNCKSDDAAGAAAARLLGNVRIRALVDAGMKALAEATGMTAQETWREYRYIAESDIAGWIDFSSIEPKLRPANQVSEATRRATKSVEVKRYTEGTGEDAREVQVMKFTFWDKPTALTIRLRALGEVKDKVEHTGKDGAAMEIKLSGNVSHEPSLEAADAAYAESLADTVIDSVADPGPDSAADGSLHEDGGPQPLDHERDPDHAGDAEREPAAP